MNLRILHKRIIGTVALAMWLYLGWDSRAYFWPYFGVDTWLTIPLLFYLFAGAALMWIITGESKVKP